MGILTYLKIIALVAVLAIGAGGAWYVQGLRADNALLTRQIAGYKRAVEILKQDTKIDAETENEKKLIDGINSLEQLDSAFERMRQRAGKGGITKPGQADHK
jgi:cell division protein FtsB